MYANNNDLKKILLQHGFTIFLIISSTFLNMYISFKNNSIEIEDIKKSITIIESRLENKITRDEFKEFKTDIKESLVRIENSIEKLRK